MQTSHPISSYPNIAPTLLQPTILPPMIHLPPTQPHLNRHTNKPRNTDPRTIAHTRCPETKLPILLGHIIRNLGKRANVDQAAQQALPENHNAHDVVRGDEVEERVQCQQREVEDLQERREVQRVDADEGRAGPGDEDADLVDGVVGAVEGAVFVEGAGC